MMPFGLQVLCYALVSFPTLLCIGVSIEIIGGSFVVYTLVQEDCVSSSQTGSLNQIGMALSHNIMECLRTDHIHVTGVDRLHIMHLLSLTTLLVCSVVCNELLS